MGGGCIPFNLPLSAPVCYWVPFRLSKHRFSNTLSQHQSNSQAKLSKPTREDFKIFKRNRTRSLSECIPIYQSSLGLHCDFCIPNWWPGPSLRGGLRPPGKTYSHPKKCLGHIVCTTIVFVHAIGVKFGLPQKIIRPLVSQAGYGSAGDCCLVTSVSYATRLSLSQSNFSGLTSNFNRRN